MKKSPLKKSKQKVEQDYARNAIADYKSGDKKAAKYEKKKELEVAAGESGIMMKKSPLYNQNKGYESNKQEKKNLLNDMPIDKKASSPMQKGHSPMEMYGKKSDSPIKMQGSWMSKHSKSYMAKSSPLHKQGYNDRLDESLGAKNGKKSQSLKDRRDESKGMEKSKGKGAYSSDSKMS